MTSSPFKVFWAIVRFNTIDMVYFVCLGWWSTMECRSNKAMNLGAAPFPISNYGDFFIPIIANSGFQNSSEKEFVVSAGASISDSSKRRRLINALHPQNWLPNFCHNAPHNLLMQYYNMDYNVDCGGYAT